MDCGRKRDAQTLALVLAVIVSFTFFGYYLGTETNRAEITFSLLPCKGE